MKNLILIVFMLSTAASAKAQYEDWTFPRNKSDTTDRKTRMDTIYKGVLKVKNKDLNNEPAIKIKVQSQEEYRYALTTNKRGRIYVKKYLSCLSRYDTLGNLFEQIKYGMANHLGEWNYGQDYGDGVPEDYTSIQSLTKYSYIYKTPIADTTYGYRKYQIGRKKYLHREYLYSTTSYLYDTIKNVLLIKEESEHKGGILRKEIYKYNQNLKLIERNEIKFTRYRPSQNRRGDIFNCDTIVTDTFVTIYSGDEKDRIVKEIYHNRLSHTYSIVMYNYNGALTKYFYTLATLDSIASNYIYPHTIVFYPTEYFPPDDLDIRRMEYFSFGSSGVENYSFKRIYNEHGLLKSERQSSGHSKNDIRISDYKYQYYK